MVHQKVFRGQKAVNLSDGMWRKMDFPPTKTFLVNYSVSTFLFRGFVFGPRFAV